MTFLFQVDERSRVITTVWQGRVSPEDLDRYLAEVHGDPIHRSYDELMDASGLGLVGLSASAITRFAESVRALFGEADPELDRKPRLAVIAGNDLVYGLLRMFAAWHESGSDPAREMKIFRDVSEAREWMGLSNDYQDLAGSAES